MQQAPYILLPFRHGTDSHPLHIPKRSHCVQHIIIFINTKTVSAGCVVTMITKRAYARTQTRVKDLWTGMKRYQQVTFNCTRLHVA